MTEPEIASSPSLPEEKKRRPWTARAVFILLSLFIFAALMILQKDFGITWDERMQGHYGKLVLRYFVSGGSNLDFQKFTDTMHFYGGLFDAVTGSLYALLFDNFPNFVSGELHDTIKGLSKQDLWGSGYYETRHVINALTGFLAILCTGLTARVAGTWRTGLIALVLITLSPQFLGHCFNNPKDIPFAAAYIMSLCFIIRLIRDFPNIRLSAAFWTAVAIAAAINMRVGGVILIFLLGLFAGSAWLWAFVRRGPRPPLWKYSLVLLLTAMAGYFGGLLVWPYGLMDPLHNPLRALQSMSHFIGAEGNTLFDGRQYLTSTLPWYYIPKWILIANPPFVTAGYALLLLYLATRPKLFDLRFLAMLGFAAVFPWAYAVSKGAVLYDGWRHFLFIYPPLVVLAALGWEALIQTAPGKKALLAVLCFFCVGAAEPLTWMIRNHPYESVYFSKFAGGLNRAQYNYETDYWGNCMREASDWLSDYHKRVHPQEMAVVGSNASYTCSFPYLRASLGQQYLPYDPLPANVRASTRMNYYIAIPRGLRKKDLIGGGWPPPRTVHTVTVDGAPLCAVVDLNPSESNPTGSWDK